MLTIGLQELGKTGNGCNGLSVGSKWLGLSQEPWCQERTAREISLSRDGGVGSQSYRTGVRENISSNGSVTFNFSTYDDGGRDNATITVLARNETLIGGGTTTSSDRPQGWQQYVRNDRPTFDPDDSNDYVDISTSAPMVDQRTVMLVGDNSDAGYSIC